ncbi:hypothetical protein NKK48_00690 [Mesorhizobium sp. C386A]|uniref:hypothetical protein n=1 Tax=unclassified Mesorhizobium TaxID=325217 RepID=UPI0004CF4FFF|nr:hypothetical protein [Mesorhizobium sp. LNJC386A00]
MTTDEILAVIRATQKVLKQTNALMSKVARAGIKSPETLTSVAQSALRLRERMLEERHMLREVFDAAFRA